MDKEKLIRVVKSKRPLWDRSNKFFRNRDHTKELWKEVAEEMDESCEYRNPNPSPLFLTALFQIAAKRELHNQTEA